MIKWIKRIFLILVSILTILILLFVTIKPKSYYVTNWIIGSQLQWFGYEIKGNEMIENSLNHLEFISASTYHAISVQNTKNGNYDEAIKYLEKAVELSPKDAEGYYGWVLLYYYRDYKRALLHLNNYDTYTPNFTDYVGDDNILYAKGLCYKQLGEYKIALDFFNKAINDELEQHTIDWIPHQIFFQKARTFQLLGDIESAIEYYDKTIEIWDGSSEAYYYKGLALKEINKDVEACENFEIALSKIEQGLKSSDSYIELFDEVYQTQIERTIDLICKKNGVEQKL